MIMFKLIGTITAALITIINDLVDAILPLTSSAKHATKALEINAQELELDAKFECRKKASARSAEMAEFEQELLDLEAKVPSLEFR